MDARKLIDFAAEDEGSKFREELYAALYDRTVAAMQERKQTIAQGFVTQEDYVAEEEEEEEKHHADEKEDEAMVKRMVKKSALKEEDDEELEEGWEDRLAAAREKAKEKGLIKDKPADEKKEPVKKVSGSRYGGSKQKSDEIDEEAEQIDELSRKTLGSYIKKASKGSKVHNFRVGMNAPKYGVSDQERANAYREMEYHNKKAKRREAGIAKAADRLSKEEVEQIDELSKKTLGNYAKKALSRSIHHDYSMERRLGSDNPDHASFDDKVWKYHADKQSKREKGLDRAVKKLSSEETEQIDELSKKTLGSYINAAREVISGHAHERGEARAELKNRNKGPTTTPHAPGGVHAPDAAYKEAGAKLRKRVKGVNTAIDKLSKEELSKEEENWHMKKEAK